MPKPKQAGPFTRQCPQCNCTITYTTVAKRNFLEKKGALCTKCNRSNVGKNNAINEECPLCRENIELRSFDEHVKTHGITSEQLYCQLYDVERQTCRCGCREFTEWLGWKKKTWNKFVLGHNASIHSSYDKEIAEQLAQTRGSNWRGKTSHWKGRTADDDVDVKKRAEKSSLVLREKFAKGELSAWSKGLTKETDERIRKQSENLKAAFVSKEIVQWHKGLTENTDDRLLKKNDDLRMKYATGELTQWHKGKNASIDPRIAKFWEKRDPIKEWEHIRLSNDKIKERLKDNEMLELIEIQHYRNTTNSLLRVKCKQCNTEHIRNFAFVNNDRCPSCKPTGSYAQKELYDWMTSLNVDIVYNDRKTISPLEIDCYVPSKKIGFEFDSLYWHSEIYVPLDQMIAKQKAAEAAGVKLFHVYEDEWRDKRDIVKSMIKHKLGVSDRKVDARKCDLVTVDETTKREFFARCHIDGDARSSIAFALRTKDGEIVACMSLRRAFHKRYATKLEVARFATTLNTNVRGAVGRLTKAALAYVRTVGKDGLLTYVDNRFANQDVTAYERAGFNKVSTTSYRFHWTDLENRFNRFMYKADKARGMTQAQVAEEAGVIMIFAPGNSTMVIDV